MASMVRAKGSHSVAWGCLGLNYMQSVTPSLSLGCEVYYIDEQRKSGLGIAARKAVDRYIATLQASTVGLLSMSYLHKVGEKVMPP